MKKPPTLPVTFCATFAAWEAPPRTDAFSCRDDTESKEEGGDVDEEVEGKEGKKKEDNISDSYNKFTIYATFVMRGPSIDSVVCISKNYY